jgi:hypothetical protein
MQNITLTKTGIYFPYWDEPSATWIDKEIKEAKLPISWYLQYPVQADEDLTVRDILMLIKPYYEQIHFIFSNSLEGVNLTDVYQLLEHPFKTDNPAPMNVLYMFKIGEASPLVDDDRLFYNMYPVLMGIYTTEEIEEEDIYHLSSYDIRTWCDLPFAIDGSFEFTNITNEELVLDGVISWTLYEVLTCVLSQLSVTMQITETIPIKANSTILCGPILIGELLIWFEDLDRILLSK